MNQGYRSARLFLDGREITPTSEIRFDHDTVQVRAPSPAFTAYFCMDPREHRRFARFLHDALRPPKPKRGRGGRRKRARRQAMLRRSFEQARRGMRPDAVWNALAWAREVMR